MSDTTIAPSSAEPKVWQLLTKYEGLPAGTILVSGTQQSFEQATVQPMSQTDPLWEQSWRSKLGKVAGSFTLHEKLSEHLNGQIPKMIHAAWRLGSHLANTLPDARFAIRPWYNLVDSEPTHQGSTEVFTVNLEYKVLDADLQSYSFKTSVEILEVPVQTDPFPLGSTAPYSNKQHPEYNSAAHSINAGLIIVPKGSPKELEEPIVSLSDEQLVKVCEVLQDSVE